MCCPHCPPFIFLGSSYYCPDSTTARDGAHDRVAVLIASKIAAVRKNVQPGRASVIISLKGDSLDPALDRGVAARVSQSHFICTSSICVSDDLNSV